MPTMPAAKVVYVCPRGGAWSVILLLFAACASKHATIRDGGGDTGAGPEVVHSSVDALVIAEERPDGRSEQPDLRIVKPSDTSPSGVIPSVSVGAPGWRNTPSPLCDVHQGLAVGEIAGVWADSRGVFVLGTTACIYLDRVLSGCPPIDGQGHSSLILEFNDGSGWRSLWEGTDANYAGLNGIAQGPLVVTGRDCGISQVDPKTGVDTCWLASGGPGFPKPTFIVDAAVAYHASSEEYSSTGSFYDFRDGAWKIEIPKLPETIDAIWGTANLAYLAGAYQLYTWSSDAPSSLRPLAGGPAARYTAAWGFSEKDVWFGNSAGQLIHYDGSGFKVLQVVPPDHWGILGLWGQDGVLYFRTQMEFGRVVNGSAEILLDKSGEQGGVVAAMWGISPTEVYLSITAEDPDFTPCRHNSMYWFDGQTFHRF
jgi:hypothetical protein